MYHIIIEQTYSYKRRMKYVLSEKSFIETPYNSLAYERGFKYPYGWIKESGTPPDYHYDVILMSENDYELGDELPIEIIGVFLRNGNDHKFIAVLPDRSIDDFKELTETEKIDLANLYLRVDSGEGWYGKETAESFLL